MLRELHPGRVRVTVRASRLFKFMCRSSQCLYIQFFVRHAFRMCPFFFFSWIIYFLFVIFASFIFFTVHSVAHEHTAHNIREISIHSLCFKEHLIPVAHETRCQNEHKIFCRQFPHRQFLLFFQHYVFHAHRVARNRCLRSTCYPPATSTNTQMMFPFYCLIFILIRYWLMNWSVRMKSFYFHSLHEWHANKRTRAWACVSIVLPKISQ